MTVSSIIPVNNYIGNNSTTVFDFDFLIENAEELLVTHTSDKEISTVLKYGIDYSIEEIGNSNGSRIVFPLPESTFGLLQNNEILSLSLNLEIKQDSKFENSSYLDLSVLEWTFDYIVRILQILNRKVDRCLKTREGTTDTPDNLINMIARLHAESVENANKAEQYAQEAQDVIKENVSWGKIYGTVSNQSDLQSVLDTKADITLCNEIVKDKLPQGLGVETGEICSDSDIYADVLSYRNSGSKTLTEVINPANYTVTGSPNISDEGYLDTSSGYDSSNCITTISGIDLREGNIKGLNISFEFRLNEIKPGFVLNVLAQNESNSVLRFGVNTSGTMYCQMWKNGSLQGQAITTTVLNVNTWYKVILSGSNNRFKIALYEDSEVSVDPEQIENPSFPLSPDEEITLSANYSLAGNISAITFPPSNIANYIFSLNDLKIEVGGELIYSPYLAINYIQSKTGSKIADAYYRYIIRQIYEENGYAPYYTIDIVNQTFTLPMGEVYGMIQKNTSRFEQTPHVVKTYINTEHSDTYSVDITSWYRIWSDGWCEQGQEAGSASDFTKDRTINLLKAYKDTNYFISGVGFVINGIGNQFISEKTPSSFTTSSNTRSAGTNHWMAAGYIDLDSEV